MTHTKTRSKYLRAQLTLPKLTGVDYFKTSQHRLAYEALIGTIWREFIKRLEDPIKVTESKSSRCVEVLGLARYFINHRTQQVTCRTKQGELLDDGWDFSFKPTHNVMVDPPFFCNKNIVGHFVKLWNNEIDHLVDTYFAESKIDFYIEQIDNVEERQNKITHAIYNAIRASTNWKWLRQDVFKALALDPELVRLARLSKSTLKERNLSELHFNQVCKHRAAYRQIDHDTPHLLWLYTIAIQEHVLSTVSANPVGDLKQAIRKDLCSERAWRILANGRQRDFDQVIKSNRRSWYYLVEYLQLHERLDRSRVISPRLASLFDNPIWSLPCDNNLVIYRDVEFQPAVFNKFINENLRRQSLGEAQQFAEGEASLVLTWLAQTKTKFDANQLRQPWSWFASKSSQWLADKLAFDQLHKLSWQSGLTESDYSGYRFTPLTNAWQVRIEAVRQRHCVDQYIERCLAGTYRVFHLQNLTSKKAYTLGVRLYDEWEVDQVTGFANRPVADELRWLCQVIADGFNFIEEGALKAIKDQERLQAERFKYQRSEDTKSRRWTLQLPYGSQYG